MWVCLSAILSVLFKKSELKSERMSKVTKKG